MCPRCAAAYENPLDRRYHAQPVSCPECGPHLSWRSDCGDALAERENALQAAALALQAGKLIAVKGMGGYHLICDARSESAVARLRQLKRRARKPLAVPCRGQTACHRLRGGVEAARLSGQTHHLAAQAKKR